VSVLADPSRVVSGDAYLLVYTRRDVATLGMHALRARFPRGATAPVDVETIRASTWQPNAEVAARLRAAQREREERAAREAAEAEARRVAAARKAQAALEERDNARRAREAEAEAARAAAEAEARGAAAEAPAGAGAASSAAVEAGAEDVRRDEGPGDKKKRRASMGDVGKASKHFTGKQTTDQNLWQRLLHFPWWVVSGKERDRRRASVG
jgi:hypothetical protein